MTKEAIRYVKAVLNRQKLYKSLECVEFLEKENKTLKDREEGFKKQIIGLCEKYYQVYERFPELKDSFLQGDRIMQENEQLRILVEKMKNCENCKHYPNENCFCETCIHFQPYPIDDKRFIDKWELAE